MAMYEIYFSPTGGTKKVTEIIEARGRVKQRGLI